MLARLVLQQQLRAGGGRKKRRGGAINEFRPEGLGSETELGCHQAGVGAKSTASWIQTHMFSRRKNKSTYIPYILIVTSLTGDDRLAEQ